MADETARPAASKTDKAPKPTARKSTATKAKAPAKPRATAKTTAPKPAQRPRTTKTEAVASAEKVAPIPVVVTSAEPQVNTPEMKKKELIDVVTERSGVKKRSVKPVVDALLAVLGEELAKGRELNLQPLGKMKINRIKQMSNGRVVMCKLRQSDNDEDETPSTDPLADAAE